MMINIMIEIDVGDSFNQQETTTHTHHIRPDQRERKKNHEKNIKISQSFIFYVYMEVCACMCVCMAATILTSYCHRHNVNCVRVINLLHRAIRIFSKHAVGPGPCAPLLPPGKSIGNDSTKLYFIVINIICVLLLYNLAI